MLRTDAIKNFLQTKPYMMANAYDSCMEVQVNVRRGEGEPIQGAYAGLRWQGFTDGLQVWKHFRIPWNAAIDPQYEDRPIRFDIGQHVEAIGMTGWDYINKCSKWVGFDFDSLIGHKQGLTGDELQDIQRKLESVPYVWLITSTSGVGLHVYVFLDVTGQSPVIVETHTEHAAIARAILNKISAFTGIELEAKVDTLGGNMWVWHEKAIPGESYEVLKEGEFLKDIPANWKEYIYQASKGRVTVPRSNVDDLVSSNIKAIIDEEHLKLLKWFEDSSSLWWWDTNKQLLVCHTSDLKEAFYSLNFKGFFDTIATGKDHGHDQNCFCFPLESGSWIIRRHTRNTKETANWFTDSSNWTTCYYNKLPSLRLASIAMGGAEDEKGFNFSTLVEAKRALLAMNLEVEIDPLFNNRPSEIKYLSNKRIKLSFDKVDYDKQLVGWTEKKGKWEHIYFMPSVVDEVELPDQLIRHLTVNHAEYGWFVSTNNNWINEPKQNISNVLTTLNYKKAEIDSILGRCIMNNWTLVNKPFQPEYPGNREWNKNSPQFRFSVERGQHKTWDKILVHCGFSLDESLLQDKWAKDNGIINGLLYLQAWCASIIQKPFEPTPYLFFTGPQNSGKSIFHEVLTLLFTTGVCRADNALTNPSGFNGELSNAIICIVEETNLSKRGWAYDRIKDWVTGRSISIHTKGKTIYDIPNVTHWIQCANDSDYCPIFPGDTRITMASVDSLETEIPKSLLLAKCEQEAAAFLYTLLNFELPSSEGRLSIPVIEIYEKREQMIFNESILQRFIGTKIYKVNGAKILFKDFYRIFIDWLSPSERLDWSNKRVSKSLNFIKGRYGGKGDLYIANISFNKDETPAPKLTRVGDRLI